MQERRENCRRNTERQAHLSSVESIDESLVFRQVSSMAKLDWGYVAAHEIDVARIGEGQVTFFDSKSDWNVVQKLSGKALTSLETQPSLAH